MGSCLFCFLFYTILDVVASEHDALFYLSPFVLMIISAFFSLPASLLVVVLYVSCLRCPHPPRVLRFFFFLLFYLNCTRRRMDDRLFFVSFFVSLPLFLFPDLRGGCCRRGLWAYRLRFFVVQPKRHLKYFQKHAYDLNSSKRRVSWAGWAV